jgi:hypothetical protein
MLIWHIYIACWKPKVTNTHSEQVIFIDIPLQQLLHEHTSALCYMYIACLVQTVTVQLLNTDQQHIALLQNSFQQSTLYVF